MRKVSREVFWERIHKVPKVNIQKVFDRYPTKTYTYSTWGSVIGIHYVSSGEYFIKDWYE